MKLYIGDTAVGSLGISKVDISTNDATIVASDMQTGTTAYARGVKLTGTGKSFAFASYGNVTTNMAIPIPGVINVLEIGSTTYPTVMGVGFAEVTNLDFTVSNAIGSITIEGQDYPISAIVEDGNLTISCDKNVSLEVFYGKDDHV